MMHPDTQEQETNMRRPADTAQRDVPKSLHTLTAVVQVATYTMQQGALDPKTALDVAARVLDLQGREDPHGIGERALALLIAAANKPEA
jgi:hypothetical protein